MNLSKFKVMSHWGLWTQFKLKIHPENNSPISELKTADQVMKLQLNILLSVIEEVLGQLLVSTSNK